MAVSVVSGGVTILLPDSFVGWGATLTRGATIPSTDLGPIGSYLDRATIVLHPPDPCICAVDHMYSAQVTHHVTCTGSMPPWDGSASVDLEVSGTTVTLVSVPANYSYVEYSFDWTDLDVYREWYGVETYTLTSVDLTGLEYIVKHVDPVVHVVEGSGTAEARIGNDRVTTVRCPQGSFSIVAVPDAGWRLKSIRIRDDYRTGDPAVDGPFTSSPVTVDATKLYQCEKYSAWCVYQVEFEKSRETTGLILTDGFCRMLTDANGTILIDA